MTKNLIIARIKYCPECGYYRASYGGESVMPPVPVHPVQQGVYVSPNICPDCFYESGNQVPLKLHTAIIRNTLQYTREQVKAIEAQTEGRLSE